MKQTIGNTAKDNQFENWSPNEDNSIAQGNDVTDLVPLGGDEEPLNGSRAQCLLVVPFHVTLDKSRDSAGAYATDEVISILHEKSLTFCVVRDKVKFIKAVEQSPKI